MRGGRCGCGLLSGAGRRLQACGSKSFTTPDLGTIASAYDEAGVLVATAADYIVDGRYVAVDEAAYFAATGALLPASLWDAAAD